MTPEEFCFWLKGLALSNMPVGDMGALVLRQAGVVLDHLALKPKAAAPLSSMVVTRLPAPEFCIHNVALIEACRGCALTSTRLYLDSRLRVFAVPLPPGTKVVYTQGQDAQSIQAGGDGPWDQARQALDKAADKVEEVTAQLRQPGSIDG